MLKPVFDGLLAGAARASISPRTEDLKEGVYLGGFGSYRQRLADGVHDDVQCRALAFGDGASTVVIAALDLVGASGPLLASIRRDASRATGLPPAAIIVACTHSHASPDLQGLWGGVPDAYAAHLARTAAACMADAHRELREVRVSAATTSLGGIVRNRRGWPTTDETLTSVEFRAEDGAPVATLVNYACHPTAAGAANVSVSRDWCGYTADAVEAARGGVCVLVNGALGDANPARDGGFDAAAAVGEAVAASALASLADAEEVRGRLDVQMRPLELPVQFDRLSERVQQAVARAFPAIGALSRAGGMRAAARALHAAGRADLAQMVAAVAGISERSLVRRGGLTLLPTQCGYIGIGDGVNAVAAPGELLSRLAAPLRASLPGRHRLVLGLAQDALGYFVPEDEWMTGRNSNYEESVSMGKHAGTVLLEALAAAIPQARSTA